jgi:intracellular multiplication protein IcmX
MKKFNPKKNIILPALAITTLGLSSLSLADTPPTPANAGLTQAIQKVGDKIVAVSFAGMTALSNAMYQFDKNLADSLLANSDASAIKKSALPTAALTNQYIQNNFSNIPNSILSTSSGMLNTDKIKSQKQEQQQMIENLTLGVPGSDTLYSNDPLVIMAQFETGSGLNMNYYNTNKKFTIGPPPVNHDNYFNIASIISPTTYTSDDLAAANTYMKYLTQSYIDPTAALDMTTLSSYLNNLSKQSGKSVAEQKYETLMKINQSDVYQSYQLSMRSNMAQKSVAIDNYENLIAERTPSKVNVSGIYDSQGHQISNPSPLQVKSYQANRRMNDPAWIKSLQSQSSTTLQREIAVELAQTIQQNHQAHLDRERLIATLSAMELQGSAAGSMMLQTKAQGVNKLIDGLGQSSDDSSSGSNDKNNNNASNQAQQNGPQVPNKPSHKKSN